MFRSATLRLTLSYLAIAMAISLLFSIALYNVTTSELRKGLHSQSQSLYNQFPVFQGDPDFSLKPQPYYETSSHRILLRLVGFNIIVLIGAGFSSYWLARRTLEPIEAAHQQQKRFTSDVSHELRTPLTAIKMESEVALLSQNISSSELKATLKSNLEEVSKLEALINNLLRLSRLEADELQQDFKLVKSQSIIKEAVAKLSHNAHSQKVKIKSGGDDLEFYGDHDSLVQLLSILLDNAIKYSASKSQVSIESYGDKNQVVFKVKDQGRGIDPAALKHVFDRFYRADDSRNKKAQDGYGLGLSIAKMIADLHKGSITLTSRVNHGTEASVNLPLNLS